MEGSAISIDFFQGRVDDLGESHPETAGDNFRQPPKRQTELAAAGQSSSEEYRTLNGEIIEANNVITALRSEHSRYNAIVSLGEENLRASSISTDLFTESTADAEQAVKDASEAVRDGAIAHAQYTASAAMVRENLEALAESQEVLNTFWQVASGQVEDYGASIETIIPTVTDLTAAENALTAAIEANLTLQDEFVGDAQALIAIYENVRGGLSDLDITQRLANEEIKLVNPAVSDAVRSMLTYTGELDNVEGGLIDTETVSENVRASLVRQGSAFDDLRANVDAATSILGDNTEQLEEVDAALKKTAETARGEFTRELENAGGVTEDLADNFIDLAFGAEVAVTDIVNNLAGLPDAIEGIGLTDVFTSLGTDLGISFAVNLLSTILSELTSGFEDSEFKRANPGSLTDRSGITN